jgi:hypothetical protein
MLQPLRRGTRAAEHRRWLAVRLRQTMEIYGEEWAARYENYADDPRGSSELIG